MITHLSIHTPKPEYRDDVLASMNRVGEAAQGAPGLIRIDAWREVDGQRLVGLAIWESMDAFHAAADRIFASAANDPWELWEDVDVESMILESP